MDGLDLAYVKIKNSTEGWQYKLIKSAVIPYPESLYNNLKISGTQSSHEKLDLEFGQWIADCINQFRAGLDTPDLLGIHGHTIIHSPADHISWQLGDGATIASKTGIATVTGFRSLDVKNGGEGAPLVPYGDFHLFSEYDGCLNLGGIANISLKENKSAWDICPCNQVLNYFANKLGEAFDKDGEFARLGNFDSSFYVQISKLAYFHKPPPKSLPNNFIETNILERIEPKDGLHTYSHLVAEQVLNSLPPKEGSKLLVTGGGAFNRFLIDLIRSKLKSWEVVVPDANLIEFKESLIFAFLALKRLRNEINTLASVTGASKDSSSGVIHLP